jgi:hypothetical protein
LKHWKDGCHLNFTRINIFATLLKKLEIKNAESRKQPKMIHKPPEDPHMLLLIALLEM